MKDEIKEIGKLYTKSLKKGMDEVTIEMQQNRIKGLEAINEEHRKLNGELREENKELKMTNLALADDITKNKIIKQEVLTECCGIPIGEIPMLKIQNDEYKQKKEKELDKYKNIVDELEKWLTKNISEINAYFDNTPFGVEDTYKEILDKLKELKGE